MLQGFGFQAATGAGGIGIGGPPSRVGGQVAFPGSHLVDSPGNELAQAHERPRRYGGRVQVVPRSREKGGPLHEEFHPYPLLQGGVGVGHQGLGREGGGRADKVGVDHGHPRQPKGEGYCTVSHCIHRQVVSDRGDRAGCLPVQGKVDGR